MFDQDSSPPVLHLHHVVLCSTRVFKSGPEKKKKDTLLDLHHLTAQSNILPAHSSCLVIKHNLQASPET